MNRVTSGVSAALTVTAVTLIASIFSASALGQTVEVGTNQVDVPSNGLISVAGDVVAIPSGYTGRVVVVDPPSGSQVVEEGGQTSYELPGDATGDSFQLLSADSTAATISSSPIYHTVSNSLLALSAASADSSNVCDIHAYDPSALGGQAKVRGVADTSCNTSHSVSVKVTATLYWLNGSGDWIWQSNATSSGFRGADASATHWCTRGKNSHWHTRNDSDVYDATTHIEYIDHVDSHNAFIHCS